MKKAVAILLCVTLLTAVFTVNFSALTQEEADAGYYLVGSMTGWKIDSRYRLDENFGADTEEYCLLNTHLNVGDEFKIAYSDNGSRISEWFPTGVSANYNAAGDRILESGNYDVFFRPNFDGHEDWFFDCIFARLVEPEYPTESTDPTEINSEIDGGYYITFKGDGDKIRQNNRLYEEGVGIFARHNLTMSTSTPFRFAYSTDLATASYYYPEDGYFTPRYNSRFYTVQFTPSGNNGGNYEDEAWYDGYVRAYPCEPPQADSTEVVPVTDKKFKRNLYEDAFTRCLNHAWEDGYTYDEVYYHENGWSGLYDWVLVKTTALDPLDGGGYGVFDDILLFNAENYPFTFGYGLYDVKNDTYYGITKAWSMDFPDLHDVFVNMVQDENRYLLGDADCDNDLSVLDATIIQRSLAGMIDLEDYGLSLKYYACRFGTKLNSLADYDADGELSVIDVTRIQRHLAGIQSLYPHSFTAGAAVNELGDSVIAKAYSSFGDEPVSYCYTIHGTIYAQSIYGSDFGQFYNDDPEPGNFTITTGYIADSSVELPVTSLTYNDDYTLTVTARDARGRESDTAVLYLRNVY